MPCQREDFGTHDIPHRVTVLERDLTILDARCRECREETRSKLAMIGEEISSFGSRVSDDVKKINKRIDNLVSYLGNKPKKRIKTKRHH